MPRGLARSPVNRQSFTVRKEVGAMLLIAGAVVACAGSSTTVGATGSSGKQVPYWYPTPTPFVPTAVPTPSPTPLPASIPPTPSNS